MSELWYGQPAKRWEEALPIGNGRLGAMVFGGVKSERIQLNEDSCWSGGFRDRNNPDAKENLQKIRSLLRENKVLEAEELARYALTGTPEYQRTYQTLGDLYLNFTDLPEAADYRRGLSLDEAVAFARFTAGGYEYTREIFASAPDDVIAVKLTTDNPAGMSFDARLVRDRFCENSGSCGNMIFFNGVNGGTGGIRFHCMMSGEISGEAGEMKTIGEYLVFHRVKEAVLYITAATSFRYENLSDVCREKLSMAAESGYDYIRGEHITDYQELEDRVSLTLDEGGNDSEGTDTLPTDKRLERVKQGHTDAGLFALYFRYGRYLLISSSRPGALPANLQGIWCKDFYPAWDSKFTININAQMNYWLAENCNLSECHLPLFEHIRRMHPNGVETAKKMYGARGFTAHHNTDIWGDTAPQDTWLPSTYWVMGAAWLCLHIWEHYEYTGDEGFLSAHFDLLKDACLFFADFLVENGRGELIVTPTVSPENTYYLPDRAVATLCDGCAMDAQILHELFTAFEKACGVLKIESDFADTIAGLRKKLPPVRIGKNGGIMEWLEEKEESEPGHRHMSHLFALFPGGGICEETPELAEAARKTLSMRLAHGGGHTGWSRAWIINFYARLGDAKEAYYHLCELLRHSTLPNLFDDHPPFQIDGNFGAAAAIANMLVQSTADTVYLLKALPDEWQNGSVTGLCAKGGLVIDLTWAAGKVIKADIFAKHDYRGKILCRGIQKEIILNKNGKITLEI